MRAPVLLPLLLILAACESGMSVHGRLLLPDGTPATGYMVSLELPANNKLVIDTTTTDADGRYEVSTEPRHGPFDHHVAVRFFRPEDGSLAGSLQHEYGDDDLDAPDVRLWDAHFAATTGSDGDTTLAWQSAPELEGASYFVSAFGYSGSDLEPHGDLLWSAESSPLGYVLPGRVIEDSPALVTVDALRIVDGFDLDVASPDAHLEASGQVSIARGARCTMGDEHGDEPLLDELLHTLCPLTDGGFQEAWWRCESVCTAVRHVTIDLGAIKPISSVVVHGMWRDRILMTPPDVEVSIDGTTFTTVAQLARPYGGPEIVELAQPTMGRFVRLAVTDDSSIDELPELAVF